MLKRTLTVMIAVLAISAVANAAVSLSIVTSVVAPKSVGYEAWDIHIVADTAAEAATATNFSVTGPCIKQVQPSDGFGGWIKTPCLPDYTVGAGAYKDDSHFSLVADDMLTVTAPDSDSDHSAGAFGTGTYLTGEFGIKPAAVATDLLLARIVTCGTCPGVLSVDIDVADAGGSETSLEGEIPCPEPATMALLGVGAVALIRRRR